MTLKDLPGSPVIKNLPSNAGGMVLIPGWGTKIPHPLEQLNPSTTSREPVCHDERALRAATAAPAPAEAHAVQPGKPRDHSWRKPACSNREASYHNEEPARPKKKKNRIRTLRGGT